METNFEYRKIDELIDCEYNFYKQKKEFTLDELTGYNGKNGKPAYIAIEGIVYDISNEAVFKELKNIEIIAGKDLTEQFNFYHRINQGINKIPRVGVVDDGSNYECGINIAVCGREKQSTCQLREDAWSDYVESLKKEVTYRKKKKAGKGNCNHQNYISLDTIAELENVLLETIHQILELQTKMLKCIGTTTGINTGTQGIGTDGSIGTKSNGVEGPVDGFLLVGGALGGVGGGLGVTSKGAEKLGGFEGVNAGTEVKLGPGATGGATGGALGVSAGTATTGTTVGSVGGTIGRGEKTDDIERDRLDIKN